MSYTPEELLTLAEKFEQIVATAKDKKKLDPKAKVRNRGTVCVPASSAKDKKDHFPINSESQARNALARVHQYSSVPSWYSGSLKSLQELVSRKVHSKYKGIGKSEKKKSSMEVVDDFMTKYAHPSKLTKVGNADLFKEAVYRCHNGTEILDGVSEALKMKAYDGFDPAGANDPSQQKEREIILKQADLFSKIYPEMEALDQQVDTNADSVFEQGGEVSPEEIEASPDGEADGGTIASKTDRLLKKYADLRGLTDFLSMHYEGTAALLRDLA